MHTFEKVYFPRVKLQMSPAASLSMTPNEPDSLPQVSSAVPSVVLIHTAVAKFVRLGCSSGAISFSSSCCLDAFLVVTLVSIIPTVDPTPDTSVAVQCLSSGFINR